MMVPQAELQRIANILRAAAAELEAGKLKSFIFVSGQETIVLAPLEEACYMALCAQVAVTDSLKEAREGKVVLMGRKPGDPNQVN